MSLLERCTIIIPFRLASARFPDKALQRFCGKTLLEHALDNARALGSGRPPVVTAPRADLSAARRVVDFGDARLIASASSCASATERAVAIHRLLETDLMLSLPVDEPALDPVQIRAALGSDSDTSERRLWAGAGALTFYCDFFCEDDFRSALSAKVVLDRRGMLLYMSRATIPLCKDGTARPTLLKKNVGVFVFRRAFVEKLARCAHTETVLDQHEGLEQLRWLELGLRVRCLPIEHVGFGIDVPHQLSALQHRLLQARRVRRQPQQLPLLRLAR